MSDSGSGNSWTLLSQEENVATLRPLAEGTDPHGDSKSQPTEVATPAKTEHPVENQQASEENMSGQFEGEASPSIAQNPSPTTTPTSDPSPTLIPTIETPPPPPSLVIPTHSLHGSDAHSQSEGLPEGPVESSPEPDSFSDSYTHISSSSPDEPPIPELLGGLELTEEDEEADRPGSEGERSEQPSQSGSSVDPQVGEERGQEDWEAKGDAEVRRRSLLASLEQIGRREEEEPEEEFQLPRRNDDSGFSVNKCILGAVILLGLGTIFFSGVFMDLDEENDYASRDLRDTEQPVKQEWQKPEAPQAAMDEGMEILNKLVKETQQIAELQAKTQAQEEELNAAKGQAAEGAQEQLRRSKKEEDKKEVEEENVNEAGLLHPVKATTAPLAGQEGESRPATASTEGQTRKPWHGGGEGEKTDLRERVKTERKDKEWKKPNHDQQERSKEVKGWKQKEERREGQEQGHRGDKGEPWRDRGDGKVWRGKEERNDQKEEKKWKKGKHDKFDSDRDEERKGHEKEKKKVKDRGDRKEWIGKDEERNDWKEEKEWKRGKQEKEGTKGKDERKERKDRKEEREWKKGKYEKLDNDREKEQRGQEEERDGTGRKQHGKRKQEKEEWKGEKEWKKAKDAYKESGKEWKEKKEWREKREQKDWKKDTDRRGRNDKDQRREQQGKEERKPWEGKEERKPWEGKEERKRGEKDRPDEGKAKREAWKEEGTDADWKQDRKRNSGREEDVDHKKQEQHRHDHHREESLWQGHGDGKPTHTHRRPSFGQPDYWVRQRERLRQNALPSRHCDSVENCARAEGTLPVQLPEFEALLEGYLAKAEEGAGVDASAREEVRTLAAEFFKDGVFVHDQMSFIDYLEDLADILEDMVDGDDSEEEEDKEEDDSDLEDEMEMFGKEVMKRFAVERSSEKTERKTGKSKKENERGRG